MRGSEFVQQFKNKGLAAWEAAALELAKEGQALAWPMVNIALSLPDGSHTAVLPVSADVFSVGDPSDFLRLPLTPGTAQAIANLNGLLLPTPKMVSEIQKAAGSSDKGAQLTPAPQDNRGANLEDYARHQATIQAQLLSRGSPPQGTLITGHKKDVVISNIARPGKVLIYGWFWPEGKKPPAGFSQPIQGRSNIHGDFYVDYSHGIRFVSPAMTVDGQPRSTEEVLRDPILSKLLSDEGPVYKVRYPAKNNPQPYRPASHAEYVLMSDVFLKPGSRTMSLVDQGSVALAEEFLRNKP